MRTALSDDRPLALVKGAGDLASSVALRLVGAGSSVVMTETAQPTAVRRTVAFAEAAYKGRPGPLPGEPDSSRRGRTDAADCVEAAPVTGEARSPEESGREAFACGSLSTAP